MLLYLVENANHRHGNLDAQPDRLEEQRNPKEAQPHQDQQKLRPVLRAVVVTGNAVQGVQADLREPKHHVCPHRHSQGAHILGHKHGVVAVHDEQRHDPEHPDPLEDIVVVVVVGILLCVGPGVPLIRKE